MSILSHLNPSSLWMYFEEICSIPRLSKNEGKLRQHLLDFAKKNDLDSKYDETGNILIIRHAAPGLENRKTVVLQSHIDMVGEKATDSDHNWDTDPIIPVVEKEWVTARETTLGADDGMGVAAQMAILTDKELKAGRIECLFTVDEESGMTGAINLRPDFFTGKTLINLDSEDEGILFIGCAGGIETNGIFKFKGRAPSENSAFIEIRVNGLHGGHSGDEIHKGYGNSIKILTRILMEIGRDFNISIAGFDGGNLRNAIPREAKAIIAINKPDSGKIKDMVNDLYSGLREEFGALEKDLSVSMKETQPVETIMDKPDQDRFLNMLQCCPHGALAWSKDMEDLVETSTNLASVKFTEKDTIQIITTQRSSVEKEKFKASGIVESCLKLAGAEVTQSDGYPGWKPDLSSEILKLTRQSYARLFDREPLVRAIHAGLECGLIYEKVKGIDMISFGPTIRGAHTTEEKIEIRTARMFWNLLKDVVSNMPLKEG